MMSAHALSPRAEKPTKRASEAEETRRALQWAKDNLGLHGPLVPLLPTLVWHLLEDAVKQSRTWPDRERSWLMSSERSIWPELARPSEENRAVEQQIRNEIYVLGLRSPDTFVPRPSVEHPDDERAVRVLAWLRYVRARSDEGRRRDVAVAVDLAGGMPVRRVRAKYFRRDASESSVRMVKQKVVEHIVQALRTKGLAS